MKKRLTYLKIVVIMAICLASFQSWAQETPVFQRNFIGATLTELPFIDFRLSYERRITPVHGVKIEIGYKPATRYFTDATIINLGQTPTGWCYRNTANWYYLSMGYRYYFNKKKTFYVSPELFYKLMTANMIMYSWGITNSSTSRNAFEVRSMHADVIGLNLLLGKKVPIKFSKGFHMGFDFYTGLSLRGKFIHTSTYGHVEISHYHDEGVGTVSIPVTDDPYLSYTITYQAMIQFGIVLFASWK